MGSLAAGGAAATGTGAFGSVEAERDVSVNVANDPNAYVGLSVPNEADFASKSGGTVEFNFDENHDGAGSGNGLNANADTYIGPELKVTNQGQDAFHLLLDPSNINDKLDTGGLSFYIHTNSYEEDDIRHEKGGGLTGTPQSHNNVGVILTTGASVKIGGAFRDMTNSPSEVNFEDASLTVYAITDDSERFPSAGPSSADSGTYPVVVDPGNGKNDYDDGYEYSSYSSA